MDKSNERTVGSRENKRHGEDEPGRVGDSEIDRTRTEDEGCEGAANSDRPRESEVSSELPDGTFIGTRQEIIGGILRQLRSLQAAHLAYVQAHKHRLEARLTENEKHQNKIAQEMDALERVIVKLLEFEANSNNEEEE